MTSNDSPTELRKQLLKIVTDYHNHAENGSGHHSMFFTVKELEALIALAVQEAEKRGMIKMVESANCILQADEPAIDEIWFDLEMEDGIYPMRQDTMLSHLKATLTNNKGETKL